MEVIKIKKTKATPEVIFDKENQCFEITGASIPENANEFYDPLLEWIDEYANAPNENTVFDINLKYFNTSSSKLILDFMLKLKEMHEKGSSVKIRWHHADDDDDMKETGQDYEDITKIPFEYVTFKEEDDFY